MQDPINTYTYRGGKRIAIVKSAEEFVVAAPEDVLRERGYTHIEHVSPGSNRITVPSADLEVSMAQAREIAPTHHAYAISETGQEFIISDRIFVTFRDGTTEEDISAFMGRYALQLAKRYSESDFLFQLTDYTGMNPVKLIRLLTEEDDLAAAADHDLDYRVNKYAVQLPLDPDYLKSQWHLQSSFLHPEYDSRASTRCDEAWQLLDGFGDPEVVIAISDDGCQLNHADFDSPDKFAAWAYWDWSASGASPQIYTDKTPGADRAKMYEPGQDHGTACAGVAAAEVDSALTVGAAPGCRLLPIRFESAGSTLYIGDSRLYETLQFIRDKADVFSSSWGSVPSSLVAPLVVQLITKLAVSGGRRGKGILFLWAAGNQNCPINYNSNTAVPFTNGWQRRRFLAGGWQNEWVGVRLSHLYKNELADVPGVLHVAALSSTAQRSHYSNYGPGVDICAPSNNWHTYYRGVVRGLGITTASGGSAVELQEFGGTSSATPLVAGIAALVISANPDLTALEVESILKRTASKKLNFNGYARTAPAPFDQTPFWDVSPVAPFDKGDFQDNGDSEGTWSPWFGYGRIDAAGAVAEAQRLREGSEVITN